MAKAKIIPVIGSPGSGSTTLAVQLALHCSEKKETVCLILTDPMLPPKSYLLKESKTNSLGFLLSFPDLSEKQILASMDAATDSIGVLGYATGDRLQDFPVPSTVACEMLLKKLSVCTDTIILDVGSRIFDKLSVVALQQAYKTIICIDGTLKSEAWLANLQKPDHCITVANRLHSTLNSNANLLLPFFPDLMQQNEEMRCFQAFNPIQKKLHQLSDKLKVSSDKT